MFTFQMGNGLYKHLSNDIGEFMNLKKKLRYCNF
jgi:hypothetical protein